VRKPLKKFCDIQATNKSSAFTGSHCNKYLKGAFKYHMTLQGEAGLLKPSECRCMGEGAWPNRRISFIVAEKA